jgi:hypothetical protein
MLVCLSESRGGSSYGESIFSYCGQRYSVSYVPWEQKNMILNLGESVNFFAIWPGIAPYLCNDCAVKVIKYMTILNFPSLKGSTIVD